MNYHVDVAIEEGDEETAKSLVLQGGKPSLYAKQMAMVNGHQRLVLWLDEFATLRNQTSIAKVHARVDNHPHKKGGWKWDECIPKQYRYV